MGYICINKVKSWLTKDFSFKSLPKDMKAFRSKCSSNNDNVILNILTDLNITILMIRMVNVKKFTVERDFSERWVEWKRRKKASNQHLLTLAVAGLPGLRGPPRSAYTLELCDWLMSSCVELEGPWREALGTTGRLSECRVIRNPSFSLHCVNGPAASIWASPEEGSPPSGWNWIVHRGAVGAERAGEKKPVPHYTLTS